MSGRAWIVPLSYAAAALAAGLLLPRLESRLLPAAAAGMSVSAATAIYSSIASGMIALTGIVFSLLFLMVQFSATAYSPRLVLWVARNPIVPHSLGVFTATFLYAIAALAWVDRQGSGTVPVISAATVVVLLIVSVCMFIGLMGRIAMLRVTRMLGFTGDQARAVINTIYPEPYSERPDGQAAAPVRASGSATQHVVYNGRPVAVQRVDIPALVKLARSAGGSIEVVPAVGDTVLDSNTLVTVVGARVPVDDRAVRRAIVLGEERTFEQDPKYALRLLVDIAIRALSPAINDPTTAVQALDQIGDILLRLAGRRLESGSYRDADGTLRVVVSFPTWEDLLRLSFDEILAYGAGNVQVARRLKALIADLLAAAPAERRAALEAWRERLVRNIARAFPDPDDRLEASVEDRQGLGVPRQRPAA